MKIVFFSFKAPPLSNEQSLIIYNSAGFDFFLLGSKYSKEKLSK